MKYILIAITALTISACAAPMHKAGATDQDAMRDNTECELQGYQYAAGLGFGGNPLIAGEYRQRCLMGRGWSN